MATRDVVRDEVVGEPGGLQAGKGTYVDGGAIKAYYDGVLTTEDGVCIVTRPRKTLPNARRRKGERDPEDAETENTAKGAVRGGGHRHGMGKHGRPLGKTKKGRGDQGAWD